MEASTASFWDGLASRYDESRTTDRVYMSAVEAAARSLDARLGEHVLDAGCGTGIPLQRYLRQGLRVTALDSSPASLDLIRKKFASGQIHLSVGDITDLPFANATFDRTLCANTLQHVDTAESRAKVVAELARCTKAGGRVVLSAHQWSRSKQRAGWKKTGVPGGTGQPSFIYRFEVDEFRSLLQQSLAAVQVFGAGFHVPRGLGKLEPLLQRLSLATSRAHMLVGVGYSK